MGNMNRVKMKAVYNMHTKVWTKLDLTKFQSIDSVIGYESLKRCPCNLTSSLIPSQRKALKFSTFEIALKWYLLFQQLKVGGTLYVGVFLVFFSNFCFPHKIKYTKNVGKKLSDIS